MREKSDSARRRKTATRGEKSSSVRGEKQQRAGEKSSSVHENRREGMRGRRRSRSGGSGSAPGPVVRWWSSAPLARRGGGGLPHQRGGSLGKGCDSFAMASGTDENAKMEGLTSAAAFVEGGIQDACDDACSICLEAFCDSDPSTLTGCKHEFHLQCILEWCQRSSQCPMCWQPISLKDPTSQELLEAVEHEKNVRTNQTRNPTIFHHPALGDFEVQHLTVVGNDAELEERVLQRLAAAAAMGRPHHLGRREGHRGHSGSHGRPHW